MPSRAVWRLGGAAHIPDNILLDISDFYRVSAMFPEYVYHIWEPGSDWSVIAQVCRQWRNVLYASPRRLRLQLRCIPRTPVRKMLDIWPPLPILVVKRAYQHLHSEAHEDNLIAALERHDRVSIIDIDGLTCRQLERVAATMQEPFPTLTYLHLSSSDEEATPTFPVTFMGGTAPLLRHLYLKGISFPTLPNLGLSPADLTTLNLHDIPSTGYISPREMVAFLSPLIRLERVAMEFKSPHPLPGPSSVHIIPSARALLPTLKFFQFKGVSEYLEDMVSQIDAPLLSRLEAIVFNQLIFTIPRISQFIQRTEALDWLDKAALIFDSRFIFSQRYSQPLAAYPMQPIGLATFGCCTALQPNITSHTHCRMALRPRE